ncbi:TIR domain-containing protein [Actinoplanes sp. NPDC049681]|uniref:TIR domain-containing protein n=1 Tax=Actinoplanes sp. NPDC049681 TaxID=3363905 RepID=UPI0037985D39
MTPDLLVAFISYARADARDFMRQLREKLRQIAPHLATWADEDRRPGETFVHAIDPVLRGCDVFIFLMTRTSVRLDNLNWCEKELGIALERRIPVVVLRLHRDAERTVQLSNIPDHDFTDEATYDWDGLAAELRRIGSPDRVLAGLTGLLRSYEQARAEAVGTERDRLDEAVTDLRERIAQEERRRDSGTAAPSRTRPEKAAPPPSSATAGAVITINEMPVFVPVRFQDRRDVVAEVEAKLGSGPVRVIAVTGAAGSGKTALLARIRDRLAVIGPAGTKAFVYLAARGNRRITAGLLLEKLCGAIPDPQQADDVEAALQVGDSRLVKLDRVVTALGDRMVVLALDDAEELLDGDRRFHDRELRDLLIALARRDGHGVRVLVAGHHRPVELRYALRDRCWPVFLDGGIPMPYAGYLLQGLDPGVLGLAGASREQLRRLHDLTQGLPRSLELLAGYLRGDARLSIDELIRELEAQEQRPTALLEGLAAHLSRTELRVVQALAVLGRPVPPAAVDHVLGPFVQGIDSAGTLEELSKWRLVRSYDGGYSLPPEPDAAFFRSTIPDPHERGEPGGFTVDALWLRAADWFATRRRGTVLRPGDLEPELSEIELRIRSGDAGEALSIMNRIDDKYLTRWGQSDVLIRWREHLRGTLGDPALEGPNLSYLAAARQQQEDTEGILATIRQAMQAARDIDDDRNHVRVKVQLAEAHLNRGDAATAASLYTEIIDEAAALRMATRAITSRVDLAVCLSKAGRFRKALGQLGLAEEAIRRRTDSGRDRLEAFHRLNSGWVHGQLGRPGRALDLVRRALELAEGLGDDLLTGRCRDGEAAILIHLDRYAEAADSARQAAQLGVRRNNAALSRQANVTLALSLLYLRDADGAATAAAAAARYTHTPRALGALGVHGLIEFTRGNFDAARAAFHEAHTYARIRLDRDDRDYQSLDAVAMVLCGLALCGDEEMAEHSVETFRRARRIATKRGIVEHNRRLLAQFSEHADRRLLERVQRAAEGDRAREPAAHAAG